jgi:hypothetical protein
MLGIKTIVILVLVFGMAVGAYKRRLKYNFEMCPKVSVFFLGWVDDPFEQ